MTITYGGEQRGGAKRTNSWDGHQPPCPIISGSQPFDLSGHSGDPPIEPGDVLEQFGQQAPHGRS